ncbi:hypothetical protein DFA_04343 [Cavenderia fasciculata]|uniref:Tetratricopeptide-like helical domain-containing protein n=1 Tax=Cavenderia fasciculata TaxID=261658 RepID=F4PPB2_CACFS|nr:uncharacterized protein DFA_04343 [Cavenderia fasciculata]EGG22225.1 hypothetical protein DFA_04343 [Cavenderia fasciculata]|eukprot:XP_004360076.1 hypothetical protein DFA_04343 [Cavenderia fasciculata]
MKFYVHFESQPEHTLIVVTDKVPHVLTVSDLKLYFIQNYRSVHGESTNELTGNNTDIKDQKGRKVVDTTLIGKCAKNGDDLFIVKNSNPPGEFIPLVAPIVTPQPVPVPTTTTPQPVATTTTPSSSSTKKTTTTTKQTTTKIQLKANHPVYSIDGCESKFKNVIESLLQRGNELYDKQSYKQAVEVYNNILQIYPKELNSLFKLTHIYLQAKKYDLAIKNIELATTNPLKDWNIYLLYGKTLIEQKKFVEASQQLKKTLDLMGKSHKQYAAVNAIFGRTLYDTKIPNNMQQGCDLLNDIVHADESNIEGLIGFAHILYDRNQFDNALMVLMQLLTRLGSAPTLAATVYSLNVHQPFDELSPHREFTKERIAHIVKEYGVTFLMNQLNKSAVNAPVLGYFASIIKEYGAIDESVELSQKAFDMDKTSANHALTLVHGLEVCNRYEDAIQVCIKYLQLSRPRGLSQAGPPPSSNKNNLPLTCGSILTIISKYIKDFNHLSKYQSFKIHEQNDNTLSSSSFTSTIPTPANSFKTTTTSEKEEMIISSSSSSTKYTKDDEDFLAFWYTIVKVLYVHGILEPLPELIDLLEPTRVGRNLHLTTVRNEHAYFCCISQLMLSYKSLPVPNNRPIYIAGDSHAMSLSWTPITVNGEPRLFHPLLTTGLKMWHLRPTSKFFPKMNFYRSTCKAPKGSEIIFMFGEIDCREGIILSVEKSLKDLIAKYDYKAYIHPVVPVLNETRFLVKTFNRILKEKIEQSKELHWLDFFDSLLDVDGGFNTKYALDGTHMNPSYIPLIENSINKYYQ